MNNNFLKTIEEMTLHSIEQEKKINTMASELAEIKALLLQKKKFFLISIMQNSRLKETLSGRFSF